MARLMIKALEGAGFHVDIASRLSSFDGEGSPERQSALALVAKAEAKRIAASAAHLRPALWFTYHNYYKAPDLVGPLAAAALGIPYVIAEGSRAPKRAEGAWRLHHLAAEAALDRADLVYVLNPRDRPMLERAAPVGQRILDLLPFVDPAEWPHIPRSAKEAGPTRLLAIAMMRPGDKRASFELLQAALGCVEAPWQLDIVGTGTERPDIEALFSPFGSSVRFLGVIEDKAALASLYARSALLVWPAVNEAFGMVFLEAALQGCPALAGAFGGVPGVVRDQVSGLLAAPGDVADFSRKLEAAIRDPALLAQLSDGARALALGAHSLDAAAYRMKADLRVFIHSQADPCAS